ncbi:conjugal transfer mating pair stabilization protein TraG [Escherichia coli]|nr:conjugal transfer mating pair stabilization protein TraG [Escherichia coli]EKR5646029.1 conjugal transfer mating pair stabilization protein TraG [Escherichia coli]
MKRGLWLLMFFLLAGHVPAASADSACEGRFVNPITDICWSCIFPLSLGSIKVSQGKVPDTANPSMPIQICPAPPPLFRRIGLAIGYWEPMALTDVTRSPGCMVNLGFSLPAFGKTAQGTAKKDEKQVNGAFYHVHWYKYPLTYWLNIITSLGCLEGGDLDIAYLSEIDPTWTDSSLTTILNPEAVIFANPIAQGACAADAIASAFNMPLDVLFWCAGSQGSMYPFNGWVSTAGCAAGCRSSDELHASAAFRPHAQSLPEQLSLRREHAVNEVYVIAGGEWLRNNLNAIAAFMGTRTWDSIEKIALTLSVVAVAFMWVQRHNVMDLLGWAAVFVLISLLVNIRTSVQIIDNSDLVKVHRADNVPVGLAMPLSLTTRIGHAMVASYEMIYTQPDSFTYSKTGMLFGAELVSKSTDFLSRNPEIANLFQDYVQNCVMGDIYLNHKYTLEELMASSDPYTLIFSRPSPLRGVYDSNNNFVTCKDASVSLKDKLNLDTQSGGKTWHYYAQQLFGGRPDPNLLFSTLIGDSYRYFYDSSKSASQIIRQNVTINALKEGITSYAARNGDSASLVNLATTSSMEKQRLAHVSIGHVAMRTLPMTQTILTGIAIGIFPLLVLAAVFNKLTLSVLKGYVFALMWLQSWPMLYAILNSAMTFYAKQNGAPVVLSEISQIQLKYSDLASTAGYLSMMIPPLSWMMVRGLGAGFSSVYSHFASSAISPTASAAGSVVDGNYSYGNMQTENVNGFSWSTNSTTSFGQMMYQTGSGATATQTRDGNMVMDASGAMSRLPVGINATRQIAAAQQEMAREASNRAESALHGFSSSIASAWNSLSQFGSNRGSSDSVTGGADSTMSAQDSMMASRMRSAVESYAKAHNISNEQATRELASRSTRGSAGMYGDAHAEWGVKPKILGVGGGVGVRGGGRASIDWSDEDAHQASSGSRASHDARHDIDARATQDFKEASDYFTSRKVSESGSHTDNNADSRVDQLSAALNSAKQSYDQYTTNMTRSHEYAEMASRTESMSGQMSEDLSQQFAQYVMKHAPQDAEAILTNTSSPEIAERRRAMAWSFVQEQVQPGVDNAWRESRGDIGKGMESVPSGGGSQDIIADHQGHQAIIEQRTQDSNIRNDVKHQVDNMVTEYRGNIGDTQSSIRGEENIVGRQYSELQNHHKTEALSQNNKYNEEKSGQERMPGADSPQELMKRAKEYQDKHKQ